MSSSDSPFQFHRGDAPLLITMQHVGTHVDDAILDRMQPDARRLSDTDWHLKTLYGFAISLGASILSATQSRYVIDMNRPSDGSDLYPGKSTTGLCPVDEFDFSPIYLEGEEPNADEIQSRIRRYWQPFHDKLETELSRLRQLHSTVVLWDAHSIRSVLPRFFEGKLPDMNFGSADGAACAVDLENAIVREVKEQKDYTWVLNGRFKGGHTVRSYGKPELGVHAMQLELSQHTYMSESYPYEYDTSKAERLQPLLKKLLNASLGFSGKR